MEARRGRSQTTLGVWMGFSGTERESVLIFDVEGTDSKERGEEHGIFERKTSLFSLALSEVLLINLWTTDVGRFEGANYGLLKTVFDLNLQLFTKQTGGPKTLLFFILRDHDPEETPLEALANTLRNDMAQLWSDIKKPTKFATSSVHDFFDFEFTSLPHFKFRKDQWMSEVTLLRDRFINPDNEKFVLKPEYKVDVPADGFSTFAESIWDTIQAEKDLDLPSQRHMLAIFRCDEISKEAAATTNEAQQTLTEKIVNSNTISEDFGEVSRNAITGALDWYNARAARYEDSVASQRREELRERLLSVFKSLFQSQLQLIVTASKRSLFQQIEKEFADKTKPRLDFPAVAENIQQSTLDFFTQAAEKSIIFPGEDTLSYKPEKEAIILEIERELGLVKEAQLKLYLEQTKTAMTKSLQKSLSETLDNASSDMWSDVRKVYADTKERFDQEVEAVLKVFKCSEEETKSNLHLLNELEFKALRSLLEEKTKDIQMLLNDIFKTHFELHDGVPRKWGKGEEEDVKKLFKQSALETEKLLDTYSVIRLNPDLPEYIFFRPEGDQVVPVRDGSFNEIDDESKKIVLISSSEGKKVLSQFRSQAQMAYKSAMQDVERATSTGNIPVYVLILGLLLGANEIWWVLTTGLTNPFFLFFLVLMAGCGFAIYHLNLMPLILSIAAPIQAELQNYVHYRLGWGNQQVVTKTNPSTNSGKVKEEKSESAANTEQ